ncbi:GyrI-like domain-containing protein [Acidobacteria bacterium AB60]|nr:GyrI-like domain-containing protein [Acidobacteria bacterium AB60]
MNLTETPEIVHWPEVHYVFVEKTGPFMQTAPAAWGEAHRLSQKLLQQHRIDRYMSLYRVGPQIYRAGFGIEGPTAHVPEGLRYEVFPGGKYSRFVLTGPYSLLPQASGRVFELVQQLGIELRDDFNIENYVKDPRVTPAEELVTEILVPTA